MDFNIDPLLNMTFDENGIEDFFKLYENRLDQELHLLKTASFIQEQIKQNQNLLVYEDYDKINEELDIYSKILEIQKINDDFFSLVTEFEDKISLIGKEKIAFSLNKIDVINHNFLEFLEQINENILDRLIEISVISSYKSTLEAFRKEMMDKIYFAINSQAESNFTPSNNEAISFIQQRTNLPLIKSLKINVDDENLKMEICDYFTTFLDIGIEMENFVGKCQIFLFKDREQELNFYEKFFSQSYAKPLKDAIKFHFLTERQTNRVDKPEWLFTFIQNSLENNLNALLEIGVKSSLKFFSRNLYTIFGEDIMNRYDDDYEVLINDNVLLLHFFDSLENFESYMMKFFTIGNEVSNLPSILQKILLKKSKSVDNLLLYERSLFDEKVFDTFKKIDYVSPSEKISSKKQLEIFSILENYCILYKKLFKKYQFITDQNLLGEITQTYTKDVLTILLQKLVVALNNFLNARKESKSSFIIMKNFWIILKNLKSFYKDQHQDRLLKDIAMEIREFKHNYVIKEVKSAIAKDMKTLINNNLRVFFKTSRILQLLTNKDKIDFEDRELKKTFKEMIILPFENELEVFENMVAEDAFGLLAIIKKEILIKILDFLFQGIFINYKMNEYGSSFTENVFNKVILLIDKKIKEKNNQIFNFYLRKLKESFLLFKLDKNDIEKLMKLKEEKVLQESEKHEALRYFSIEEFNILNKSIYLKII